MATTFDVPSAKSNAAVLVLVSLVQVRIYQELIDQTEQFVSRFASDRFIQKLLLLLGRTPRTNVDFELLGVLRRDVYTRAMQPVGAHVAANVEPSGR